VLVAVTPFWLLWALASQQASHLTYWAGVLIVYAAVGLTALVWAALRQGAFRDNQRLVGLFALFALVCGIRDYLVVHWGWPGEGELRWLSIGGGALILCIGWVLIDQATAWARAVHQLNDTLAQTIAQREAQLRAAFERLQAAERQRVLESERRRLMRDMHDGLGSQLVQTLNLVRSDTGGLDREALARMLSQALDELRLTLDSLEPMDGDLPAVLGTLRRRVEPALQAAGIELRWEVQDVPPLQVLDARGVMHLFRCLQEIFANAVKHAQARRITVSTWVRDEHVVLTIEDNGIGWPATEDRTSQGRGLRNVLTRAAKIGAAVHFYDAHPGAGIELVFPLHGPVVQTHSGWGDPPVGADSDKP
jgi:signal transduction histidine kinase